MVLLQVKSFSSPSCIVWGCGVGVGWGGVGGGQSVSFVMTDKSFTVVTKKLDSYAYFIYFLF